MNKFFKIFAEIWVYTSMATAVFGVATWLKLESAWWIFPIVLLTAIGGWGIINELKK